jgi:CelD/BcsL family acetyltransferase involved in cellulose biosynthesis
LNIECHTTPAVFEALSDEWDETLGPTHFSHFFLLRDWQRLWWKYLQRGELCVLTVRDDDGALLGIGPWFIEDHEGLRTVHTIGCVDVTDYLDIIARPGHTEKVIAALLDFMLSQDAPGWDAMNLCSVPETSPTLTLFPQLAESRGLAVTVRQQDVCPVLVLPDNWEDYLAILDKKQRHELRRKLRRAEAGDVDWYIVGPEHDLAEEIDAFLTLMARSTPDKAEFLKMPGHRSFFEEMGRATFNAGHLQLCFLTVEGERSAAMWNFVYDNRVMVYNSGLDPDAFAYLSPGVVLGGLHIRHAIEQGIAVYDFLRGGEVYKYRLGGQDTTVYNLLVER